MHRFEGILARYTRCLGPIQSRNQRVTRVELATFSLATRRSTTELHPHFCLPAAAFSEGWRGRQIMSSRPRGATFNCRGRLEIVESKQGAERILWSNQTLWKNSSLSTFVPSSWRQVHLRRRRPPRRSQARLQRQLLFQRLRPLRARSSSRSERSTKSTLVSQ